MLDWLIIGGGIHGTHLSLVLRQAGVSSGAVAVLDPEERPVAAFWRLTEAVGMRFLRSPGVHHLGIEPFALGDFARTRRGRDVAAFQAPYDRPSLALFRRHVEALVEEYGLDALRLRGRALGLAQSSGGWLVRSTAGDVASRRVVLALGMSGQPCVPEWAREAREAGVAHHLFEPGFDRRNLAGGSVVVVGGGISAAQAACALAETCADVVLLARHEPRVHRFDSDPEWLGPRGMSRFDALRDPAARRRMIAAARHRGSMPPDVRGRLSCAVEAGRVRVVRGEASSVRLDGRGGVLQLAGGGVVRADRIVLATGFDQHRPGGAFVDELVAAEGLSCAECGFPVISRGLEWAPGLFVMGPLAELELGPTSRNIAGARVAARRIARAAA